MNTVSIESLLKASKADSPKRFDRKKYLEDKDTDNPKKNFKELIREKDLDEKKNSSSKKIENVKADEKDITKEKKVTKEDVETDGKDTYVEGSKAETNSENLENKSFVLDESLVNSGKTSYKAGIKYAIAERDIELNYQSVKADDIDGFNGLKGLEDNLNIGEFKKNIDGKLVLDTNSMKILGVEGEHSSNEELDNIISKLNLISVKNQNETSSTDMNKVYRQDLFSKQRENVTSQDNAVQNEDVENKLLNGDSKMISDSKGTFDLLNNMNKERMSDLERQSVRREDSESDIEIEMETGKFESHLRLEHTKKDGLNLKNINNDFSKNVMRQINEKMNMESAQKLKSMEISLKPESLGKIVLKIVSENGILSAKLITSNEKVKSAIDLNIEELKQNLESQGIDIKSIDVSVDSDESAGSFEGFMEDGANFRNKSYEGIQDAEMIEDQEFKEDSYTGSNQELNYLA